MTVARVEIAPKLVNVFHGTARYRGAYGGRGSAKSFTFALMLAIRGYAEPLRILCTRELQYSIKDSVHSEIIHAIEKYPWLAANYEWGESFIKGKNGTTFIFRGLRHNYREIKSLAKINICWVEEAEAVSEESWRYLTPTIREPGSEIWATWNSESEDSPVRKRFILNPMPDLRVALVNWRDNPWFPESLEQERIHCLKSEPDLYHHIWEGECITRTDAQILGGKWVVDEFTVDEFDDRWNGPYLGADFGFASDPTALTKCWIFEDRLFVEYESYVHHLELDCTADRWMTDVPGCEKHIIYADNSRPETISYLRRHGMPHIRSCEKWPGCVEDGIAYLRSFNKIVIHPRCKNTAKEARLYSYKVDRLSGAVLPTIIDAYNHGIDSVRYGQGPMIKRRGGSFSMGRAIYG